jgi:type VI secretion system FHA domain protein
MQLSLTVLRCPDQVTPEARSVSGGEYHVGRGPDVDWVLPDPERLLSKKHFAVAFRGGAWQVADTSTNGTYMNAEQDPIGKGTLRTLRDGDRLRLGAYEIEVRLEEDAVQPGGFGAGSGMSGGSMGGGSLGGGSPFGDPFADDLLAPPPPPRRPFDEPEFNNSAYVPTSAQLPHDFDPLGPMGHEPSFPASGGFGGHIQSDHSSPLDDAIKPPPVIGYAAPGGGGIPDDWADDLLVGIGSPAAPAPQAPMAAPMATPVAPIAPPPVAPLPAAPVAQTPVTPPPSAQPGMIPLPDDDDLFGDIAPPPQSPATTSQTPAAHTPAAAPPDDDFLSPHPAATPAAHEPESPFGETLHSAVPAAAPIAAAAAVAAAAVAVAPVVRQRPPRPAAPPADTDPFDEPGVEPVRVIAAPPVDPASDLSPFDERPVAPPVRPATPPPVATAAPAPAPHPATGGGDALAAFMAGARLPNAMPADPMAMMTELGRAFRAVVSGLREVLIARATIKSEFRIEQTMIRARGNNPLKFSADDDDALTALLGVGRRTDMAPSAAVEDSLRDIRMHEVAVMAAMQVAVRGMLDELSPDKIRASADQGGMALLPAQRKARAWDAYEARHTATVQALADDFDSIFGKNFARAYERALAEISSREN